MVKINNNWWMFPYKEVNYTYAWLSLEFHGENIHTLLQASLIPVTANAGP
jgi:hypothetical protein